MAVVIAIAIEGIAVTVIVDAIFTVNGPMVIGALVATATHAGEMVTVIASVTGIDIATKSAIN